MLPLTPVEGLARKYLCRLTPKTISKHRACSRGPSQETPRCPCVEILSFFQAAALGKTVRLYHAWALAVNFFFMVTADGVLVFKEGRPCRLLSLVPQGKFLSDGYCFLVFEEAALVARHAPGPPR